MRDPTRPQPPTRARVGLLAGGLALVVAGVAVLAFVLASAAECRCMPSATLTSTRGWRRAMCWK